ncbi:hypothetical protein HOY80DRAFT_994939 [Tuber brumale]|nr:hypothetical protein HOY80DRAFT_994939 [Tuber brumale]
MALLHPFQSVRELVVLSFVWVPLTWHEYLYLAMGCQSALTHPLHLIADIREWWVNITVQGKIGGYMRVCVPVGVGIYGWLRATDYRFSLQYTCHCYDLPRTGGAIRPGPCGQDSCSTRPMGFIALGPYRDYTVPPTTGLLATTVQEARIYRPPSRFSHTASPTLKTMLEPVINGFLYGTGHYDHGWMLPPTRPYQPNQLITSRHQKYYQLAISSRNTPHRPSQPQDDGGRHIMAKGVCGKGSVRVAGTVAGS